jgi:phage-related protein (TIGR01555 family)
LAEVTDLKQVSETKNPVKIIPSEVLAKSAMIRRPSVATRSPFEVPSFPPAVENALKERDIPTLAMDETISGTFGWASRDFIATAYAEGVVFMGYAYLASLSQRPEYRVVTEVIASEMTREWIELKAASGDESKSDKIKKINDKMDNLRIRKAFQKATEADGFFGRGHLYLDTGKTHDDEELRLDLGDGRNLLSKQKVGSSKSGKAQKLIRVLPVEPTWCYPTRYDSVDPLSPDWYNPITWFVMSREVHRSRLLTFVGREMPDILKPAYAFGGLSMSQMLKPYVDNWLRTRQSVSDLIQNFSHSVLKTNMDATTAVGGDALFARVALFNNIKNNQGAMVIDKDAEDFSNVSAPLGGLDSLQAQSQEHMAAIARIPLVKLLGIQPAGLNASSEGELVSFEDWIAAFQEVLYRPNLTKIIDLIQLSEFDEVDDDITFDFKPLRQEKPEEIVQREQVKATTRETYYGMGAVDPQEVRDSLAQDPDSPFDGVDLTKELPAPPQPPGVPGVPQPPGAASQPGGPGGPPGGGPPSPASGPPGAAPPKQPSRPPAPGGGAPGDNSNDNNQKLVDLLNAKVAADAGFDPKDHPHAPEGTSGGKGGQFVSKGSGASAATAPAAPAKPAAKAQTAKPAAKKAKTTTAKPKKESTVGYYSLTPAPANKENWPEHAKDFKIPPAWTDVRINMDPNARGQLAGGKDSKGRIQPLFHQEYRDSQDAKKFELELKLTPHMPEYKEGNDKNLTAWDGRTREHATCLGIIMQMGLRPGSERDTGAEKQAYGATTLQGKFVKTEGDKTFLRFTGKKGVSLNLPVEDPELAASLRKMAGENQGKLFTKINDQSLRDYTKHITKGLGKPKDFRTLFANKTANEVISKMRAPPPGDDAAFKKACQQVALAVSKKLGNTPDVALRSYINPIVFSGWR